MIRPSRRIDGSWGVLSGPIRDYREELLLAVGMIY